MKNKEQVSHFVLYHDIIRPIQLSLLGLVFFPTSFCLCFTILYFFSKYKHPIERSVCIAGIIVSALGIIAGAIIRKKCIELYKTKSRGILYKVELLKYFFLGLLSVLLFAYIITLKNNHPFVFLGMMLGLIIITIISIPKIVDKRIEMDNYANKDYAKEKRFIIESSAVVVLVFIILKSIVLNMSDAVVYTFMISLVMFSAEYCIIFVILYYMKLKYAKNYGLADYLPDKPIPSPYTNWE